MCSAVSVGHENGRNGLFNPRNTCFANAVVQALYSIPEVYYTLTSPDLSSYLKGHSATSGNVAHSLGDIFRGINNSNAHVSCRVGSCVDFLNFTGQFKSSFASGNQQDAHEFLVYVLNWLHDEFKVPGFEEKLYLPVNNTHSVLTSKGFSFVSHHFSVLCGSVVECCACSHKSTTYDPPADVLSLALPRERSVCTLMELFDEMSRVEFINDFTCPNCSVPSQCTRQMVISRFPPVLVIHLMRFQFIDETCTLKLKTAVNYPLHLNVSNVQYELVAVVWHKGEESTSGHYTAACRSVDELSSGVWYECDDLNVSKTSSSNLGVADSSAYLLFYVLRGHTGTTSSVPVTLASVTKSNVQQKDPPIFCNSNIETLNYVPQNSDLGIMPAIQSEIHSSISDSPNVFTAEGVSARQNRAILQLAPSKQPPQKISTKWKKAELLDQINKHCTGEGSEIRVCCADPSFGDLNPVLEESDIPGANIHPAMAQKARKAELEWWLQCRGLPTVGRKEDLLKRLMDHIKMGKGQRIDPKVKGGSVYEKKQLQIASLKGRIHKAPIVPISGWKKYTAKILPEYFNMGCVINYIFERATTYSAIKDGLKSTECETGCINDEGTEMSTSRKNFRSIPNPLNRGIQFLKSCAIDDVWEHRKGGHCFIKASVSPSMSGPRHTVTITLSQSSGYVCEATCRPCKQEDIFRCSHICAVLLLIADYGVSQKSREETTTDKPQYWGKGGNQKNPGIIRKKKYDEGLDIVKRATFDPRGTAFQSGPTDSNIQTLKEKLQASNALLCLNMSEETDASNETAESPDPPPLNKENPDFILEVINNCNNSLPAFGSGCHGDSPTEIHSTVGQSKSSQWKIQRSVRATASEAKTIFGFASKKSTEKGKMNFLRRHMWSLGEPDPMLPAFVYGNENEGKAREEYLSLLRHTTHPEATIVETGMWINPRFPQLSCSPDGLIVIPSQPLQLLEIKCPISMKNFQPSDFQDNLTKKQLYALFLKRETSGKITLKKTSKYYFQVQMSLDILQLNTCHFIVWSPKGLLVLLVEYDKEFWVPKREVILRVHRTLMLPEFFLQRTMKGEYPLEIEY